MKEKFSYDIIQAAMHLVKIAEQDYGPLGEEKAYAMLDAFDPGLKRQMLMELIMGNGGRTITIEFNRYNSEPKTVSAIKAIRYATGFGLKESKEIVDLARNHGETSFTAKTSIDQMAQLDQELQFTGFRIKGRKTW